MNDADLYLQEEALLLALHDDKGTTGLESFYAYALAGGLLAELLLAGRVKIETHGRKKLVRLIDQTPFGNELLDDCLVRVATDKPRTPDSWIAKLTGLDKLKHRVAQRLCDRGILRASEGKVLWLFPRKTYPEIDGGPEQVVIRRLRRAIFEDVGDVDSRTVVLAALAHSTGLLAPIFGRKHLRQRKMRLKQLVSGDLIGNAAQEAVEAAEAAIVAMTVITSTIATTSAVSS